MQRKDGCAQEGRLCAGRTVAHRKDGSAQEGQRELTNNRPANDNEWTMASLQRLTAYFSGRVQGVGFRYTARRVAGQYPLTGFVRNLDDGRVELIAEGTPPDLEAFLADLSSEMAHCSHRVQQQVGPATGEFTEFSVRR